MRIIAGSARGTKLISPPGMQTRPMVDRVKQALFNIVSEEVPGSNVLDLFAGSGALGLEALSRGAGFCHFVEKNPETQQVLRKNIAKTGFEKQSKVLLQDAFYLFKQLPNHHFHLFFFDPPYHYLDHPVSRRESLAFLSELVSHTSANGAMMVFHYRKDAMSGVPVPKPLTVLEKRPYGSTELMFLRVVLEKSSPETAGIQS